jgi:crotonobetainyl-CoA:carnitine CoA-transferase CaiB-like acyl-CoA transferase
MQVENVIRWLDWTWLYTFKTGRDRPRAGNRDLAACPSDLFRCTDGWVALAAFSKEEFKGLCQAMDQMSLYERYSEPLDRLNDDNAREILGIVTQWALTRKVEEVEEFADRFGFAAARVLEAKDVYHSPHFRDRTTVQEYDDALYGPMVQHCYPPRMSETPSRLKWSSRPLGFDNEYVFTKILGLPQDEVRSLQDEGVIFKWNPKIPSHCPPPDWDGKRGIKLG